MNGLSEAEIFVGCGVTADDLRAAGARVPVGFNAAGADARWWAQGTPEPFLAYWERFYG